MTPAPRLADFLDDTAPWGKQEEAFAFARTRDLAALFLEQRVGKTPVALGLIAYRYELKQIDAALALDAPK